jgi:hypothetical protein
MLKNLVILTALFVSTLTVAATLKRTNRLTDASLEQATQLWQSVDKFITDRNLNDSAAFGEMRIFRYHVTMKENEDPSKVVKQIAYANGLFNKDYGGTVENLASAPNLAQKIRKVVYLAITKTENPYLPKSETGKINELVKLLKNEKYPLYLAASEGGDVTAAAVVVFDNRNNQILVLVGSNGI